MPATFSPEALEGVNYDSYVSVYAAKYPEIRDVPKEDLLVGAESICLNVTPTTTRAEVIQTGLRAGIPYGQVYIAHLLATYTVCPENKPQLLNPA